MKLKQMVLLVIMMIALSICNCYALDLENIYFQKVELTGNEEGVIIYTNILELEKEDGSSKNMVLFGPNENNSIDHIESEDEIILDDSNTGKTSDGYVWIKLNAPLKEGTYFIFTDRDKNPNGENIYVLENEFKIAPEFDTFEVTKVGNTLNIHWIEKNHSPADETKVKLLLVTDKFSPVGTLIGENLSSNGTATFEIPDTLNSGTYYVKASIKRLQGDEKIGSDVAFSEGISIANPKAPSVVTGLSATNVGNKRVEFSWTGIIPQPDKYYVYVIDSLGEKHYLEVDGSNTSTTSTNFDVGRYGAGIYASKIIDEKECLGENSSEISFEIEAPSPPVLDLEYSTEGNLVKKLVTQNGNEFMQTFINSKTFNVTGRSDKNSKIEIYLNDVKQTTLNDKRDFSYDFNLEKDGAYNVEIVAISDRGDKRKYYYDFEVDTQVPYLEVLSPSNGEKVNDTFIKVLGQSEPSVDLKVNGLTVDMDEEGFFDYNLLPSYSLSNVVTIIATDNAGNKTEYEANLANKTHEIVSFKIGHEKETMYIGETQLVYGVVVDILGNENRFSNENIEFSLISGNDVINIDNTGKVTAIKEGKAVIRVVLKSSSNKVLEGEATINVIKRPESNSHSSNNGSSGSNNESLRSNNNEIFTQKINMNNGGTLHIGEKVKLELPIGSIEKDVRLEANLIDIKEVKLPDSNSMKLESDVISIKTTGSRKFKKPVKLVFDFVEKNGKNKDNYGIYYFNEKLDKWLYVGGEIVDGKIVAEIGHLTKFAVFYNENLKQMNDISSHWAKKYIKILVGRNIVSGVQNADKSYSYFPEKDITRAEFATLIVEMNGYKIPTEYNINITDYDEIPTWAMGSMQSLLNEGVLAGIIVDGKRYLNPNDKITKEQIVTILSKTYDYKTTTKHDFVDSDKVSPWASEHLSKMVELGIITGKPDGTFTPKSNASRAECATILFKMLELIESK